MEGLMADFKAQHEVLHTENARLKVELAQVAVGKDALLARCAQLEEGDRLALHSMLGRLHNALQTEIDADTTYTACVQDLANSQETRLQLKRQVQQLQSALESERSAAHTVAARVQHEQRRASAEYTAAETNIRQAHEERIQTLRHEAEAAQQAAGVAADRAAAQLIASRSENASLAAALDKERAAFAANGATRNEAVWKGRLRELKKELDRVKEEKSLLHTQLFAKA